jgi:hypothetical protein
MATLTGAQRTARWRNKKRATAQPPPAEVQGWRKLVKVHPAADLFPMMSDSELEELGRDIEKNGLRHEVVLWTPEEISRSRPKSVFLLDGRNRLEAIERYNPSNTDELWRPEDFLSGARIIYAHHDVDPWAYVVSANMRRRHLSSKQKRDVIASLLKAAPQRSDNATAKLVAVSDKTVGAVRRDLEATSEIPKLSETVGADGKTRRRMRTEHEKSPAVPRPTEKTERAAPEPAPTPRSVVENNGATRLFSSCLPAEDEEARLRQDATDSLHRALTGAVNGMRNIPIFLAEVFEREAWKRERIFAGGTRQPPISFHDYIHAPYPVGLGQENYDVVRAFIHDDALRELYNNQGDAT